jgi:hypothetical protein
VSNAVAVALAQAHADGRKLLNLSESNPTRCGLTMPDATRLLADPAAMHYDPDPQGLLLARTALADRDAADPDDYFLTASTSEAYGWLFKLLCDPGDAILVPKPGYPLFDCLAGLDAVKPVPYQLEYHHPGPWQIDLDQLQPALQSSPAKAIVLIHPNNPTGSYVSDQERQAIFSSCTDRNIAVIADEVFRPYAIDVDGCWPGRPAIDQASAGPAPRSLDDCDDHGGNAGCLVFVLDGLSKLLGLPQFKLGWIRLSGPPQLVAEARERLTLIADTYLSVGSPVMHALPALLPRADRFVLALRQRIRDNLSTARAILETPDSPYRVLRCDGGWTAIIEIPRVLDDETLILRLIHDADIQIQPGYFYDMPRDGYLMLSLILDPGVLREALEFLKLHLDRLLAAD